MEINTINPLSLGDSDGDYKFSYLDIPERKELDSLNVNIPLKYIGDNAKVAIGKVNGHIRIILVSGIGMDGWMVLMNHEGNVLHVYEESADEYMEFSAFTLSLSEQFIYMENQYHLEQNLSH
jgi:hypothetical protein